MIDFYESKLKDLFPSSFSMSIEVQALSYSISQVIKKLVTESKKVSFWSMIETADEKTLDYLAVELRAQYYDEKLSPDKKRKIIKDTLDWYSRAGTKWAVEELVAAVFGYGEVIEWPEYGGKPYHFKIKTSGPWTEDRFALFLLMLKNVKNTRSLLDEVLLCQVANGQVRTGITTAGYMHNVISDVTKTSSKIEAVVYYGSRHETHNKNVIKE